MNNSAASAYTSLCLKVVGVILIVSSILDYAVLLIPFQIDNSGWQINVVRNIVDTGIIPMVGIALLLIAYWVEAVANGGKPVSFDLRPIALWLAAILGALFLIFIPFYGIKVSQVTGEQLTDLEQRGEQAASQIQTQSDRLNQVLANPDQLKEQIQRIDQALQSGRVPNEQARQQAEQQKQLFQSFIDDPEAAQETVTQRITQLETQVGSQKDEAVGRIKTEATKTMLKTCLSSFFLTIGYIAIGWSGLRSSKG